MSRCSQNGCRKSVISDCRCRRARRLLFEPLEERRLLVNEIIASVNLEIDESDQSTYNDTFHATRRIRAFMSTTTRSM